MIPPPLLNPRLRTRYKLSVSVCVCLWLMPAFLAHAAATDPPATARAVIDKLVADVLVILRDPNISKPDRRQKIEQIAYEQMDFDTLCRLTMGPHWRQMSDQQKKDFSEEYKKHLTATYGHTADQYTDEDVKITGDRTESDGDVTVTTSIIGSENGGPRKEIAKVNYRLRSRDGSPWKIIDFNIDGVSLVTNFRSQFQEIIANGGGGGIDHLIKLLHDKNAGAAQ
jgi:phospholipid transport system substrate-binding protein